MAEEMDSQSTRIKLIEDMQNELIKLQEKYNANFSEFYAATKKALEYNLYDYLNE